MTKRMPFQKAVKRTKRRFRYTPDARGKDVWRFPFFRRGFWWGDCEDFCFAVIRRCEGSKAAAINAIRDGKYTIWFCTTDARKYPKGNHALVQYHGLYAEVIFGRAVTGPNRNLGTIRLVRPMSAEEVLTRLGVKTGPDR